MELKDKIDITTGQLKLIESLLQKFLPHTLVWAFGSRIHFNSRPESDLDLAAFTRLDQKSNFNALKEALSESNLPFRVDLLEWNGLPENFKEIIMKGYVVMQDGTAG